MDQYQTEHFADACASGLQAKDQSDGSRWILAHLCSSSNVNTFIVTAKG